MSADLRELPRRAARGQRMRVSVVIIDDFPLARDGLTAALEIDPGIEVIGEAASADAGIARLRELRPDVALVDLRLPDVSGVELIERITAEPDAPPVLVVTAIEKLDTARAVAEAGAAGYVSKGVEARELRNAVITVHGGGLAFEPLIAAALEGGRAPARAIDPEMPMLTPREQEVLRLLAQGYTDNEIAERLAVSVRTVHSHVGALRRKTGLPRRSALASWAIKHAFD